MNREKHGSKKKPASHPFRHKPPTTRETVNFIDGNNDYVDIKECLQYKESRMWYEEILDI